MTWYFSLVKISAVSDGSRIPANAADWQESFSVNCGGSARVFIRVETVIPLAELTWVTDPKRTR